MPSQRGVWLTPYMCIILFKLHPTLLWKLPELFDLLPLRLPTTESPPRTKQQMKKKCCCFRQALLARPVPAAMCSGKKIHALKVIAAGCIYLSLFKVQGLRSISFGKGNCKQHQPKPLSSNCNPGKEASLPPLLSSLQGSHLEVNAVRLMSRSSASRIHSSGHLALPGLNLSP